DDRRRADAGRARASTRDPGGNRGCVRAPAPRAAAVRGPGVRGRVRAQPRLDQGDGAAVRGQLPDDQEPPASDFGRARSEPGGRVPGAEPARGARSTRARRAHARASGEGAQAMTFPPTLLRLRVRTPEHAWPTLWLPLFLLWAILLLLLVPLAVVAL